MCGLVAAGKTTLAGRLAADLPAVRLSRDEWMLRLFGGTYDDATYVERLGPCTDLMWEVALEIVRAGAHVVLDWNFWSRERRLDAKRRADEAGVEELLHWLDLPLGEVMRRARRRREDPPPGTHQIDEDGVRQMASIFEPPTADEGIAIDRHE